MKHYHKIALFVISGFIFIQNINAQADTLKLNRSKKNLIEAICDCISKTDSSTINNADDIRYMLSKCMYNSAELYAIYVLDAGYDLQKMPPDDVKKIVNNLIVEINDSCPALKNLNKRAGNRSR